eukprot:5246766-Prymnesium_polylepis.1
MGRSEALERPWLDVGWKRGALVVGSQLREADYSKTHKKSLELTIQLNSCYSPPALRDAAESPECGDRLRLFPGGEFGPPPYP